MGEIEYQIRPKFGYNCSVLAINRRSNVFELIAFIEANELINNLGVLEYLIEKLPSYMVPTKIFFLNEFPLNTSGKTDKKKLREAFYG